MKGYNESSAYEKIKIIIHILFQRNGIICHDFRRKAIKKRINLNYWMIDSSQDKNNLGDYLSIVVYRYMLDYYNLSEDKEVRKTKHLYAIGSILLTGFQDCIVWGTGILDDNGTSLSWKIARLINRKFRRFDIRAVRGPKTRDCLENMGILCPAVYGDPAILMPLFYMPNNIVKDKEYLVINHYSVLNEEGNNSISFATKDYKHVINEIVSSNLVISGSLHGIILAEAYGVPAVLLKDRSDMSLFKYEDYYYSTGRYKFPVADNIKEALEIEPLPIPDFAQMRNHLINVFPKDIWE